MKEITYIDMLSDIETLSENDASCGSDSSLFGPPEQANPNCFVTTELFGFVFYFDYPY